MVLYFKSRSRSVDSIVKTPESPAEFTVIIPAGPASGIAINVELQKG